VVMSQLLNGGIPYEGGYILKSDFVFGGAFSLDGVHPTARGYAMIANMFSAAINAKYGSNLPPVKLSAYPVLRPKSF
jgi:lysophospholipase L1-like esterase